MSNETDPVVAYTLKEVLIRIESKFDRIADSLLGRVDTLNERVTSLEHERQSSNAHRAAWANRLMLVATLAMGAAAIVAIVHG